MRVRNQVYIGRNRILGLPGASVGLATRILGDHKDNVEKYMKKCLESLKGQTLREIEVICIDNGSTDESGRIAEEYKTNELPVFRVIHTENRDLSAARNRGIDEAYAEWLMLVDSDDWVDRDFCKVPYEVAIGNQADFVCFGAYRFTKWSVVKKSKKIDTPTGSVDEMTAYEYGGVTTWNKTYKQTLFSDIR